MKVAFQILMPGFDYDVAHAGKGASHGWMFYTCYNSEQANTMKERNASEKDKDFVVALNWKLAEKLVKEGKAKDWNADYRHNLMDEDTRIAHSKKMTSVKVLNSKDFPGLVYYMPAPKSPHGLDVDPSGEYIVAGGKLSKDLSVHSFSKMMAAIEKKDFSGEIDAIPIIKYESVLAGVVVNTGLGPLHTEFDDKGYAYTSNFLSNDVIKWKLGEWKVVDSIRVYYNIGHLMIPGGDSTKPWGKYLVAMNKTTKERYLPTGPELCHAAQLIDISGDKMKLLLDFPTIGEPHYAQALPADIVWKYEVVKGKRIPNRPIRIFDLAKNKHPYATKKEADAKVERKGKEVHINMTSIQSHFAPDNIEGIKVGDVVYFHVTNLQQQWDVPHGFAVQGANNAELLVMPGETRTLKWVPKRIGVWSFYCTDFCSALHQEMQGYIRVSPADSKTELKWNK